MSMTPTPAMSNTERQRQFRKRNPGYYASMQATRRASIKRSVERLRRERTAQPQDAAQQASAPGGHDAAFVLINPHSV